MMRHNAGCTREEEKKRQRSVNQDKSAPKATCIQKHSVPLADCRVVLGKGTTETSRSYDFHGLSWLLRRTTVTRCSVD